MTFAPATWILVAANGIVFWLEERAGGSRRPEVALRFGAQHVDRLRRGESWRLFTSMFLHFGAVHLLCNMVSLWNLGPALERFFGLGFYLFLYFGSGLAGNLVTWARDARSPAPPVSAGASGAVFGLLGAYLALAAVPATRPSVAVSSLLAVLALNLAYGFQTRAVNMSAHLGGLAFGFLVSLAFLLA